MSHSYIIIYHLAKERGYRPYPFNDGQTLIVIDEKEKEKLKRPYINIYTFDEFIKSKKWSYLSMQNFGAIQ